MTEEELAAIRLHLQLVRDGVEAHVWPWFYRDDVSALLAEVDRLSAENAAMRPIVEWAARQEPDVSDELYDVASCPGCGAEFGVLSLKEGDWDREVAELEHRPDCPVILARALLAKEGDA